MFFSDFSTQLIANEYPAALESGIVQENADCPSSMKPLIAKSEEFYQKESEDILKIADQVSLHEVMYCHQGRAQELQALLREIREREGLRISSESIFILIDTQFQTYHREFEAETQELQRRLYPLVVEDENERRLMNYSLYNCKERLHRMARSHYDSLKQLERYIRW